MILLTDEEMLKVIWDMGVRLESEGKEINQAERFNAVAEAQLKKVVGWIEDRGIVASPPIPDINFKLESGDLWLSKHDWQTLKKEVEDGLE